MSDMGEPVSDWRSIKIQKQNLLSLEKTELTEVNCLFDGIIEENHRSV